MAPRKDTAGQSTFLWVHALCGMGLRGQEACLCSGDLGHGTLSEVTIRTGVAEGLDIAHFPDTEPG